MTVEKSKQPQSSRKRRRTSQDGPLVTASRRLLSLDFPRPPPSSSWGNSKEPVAFSDEGLVAYRIASSQPPRQLPSSSHVPSPFVIALKPLVASWKARPLQLSVPVLPVPNGGYSLRFLSFSSPGTSLVAVIEPDEDAILEVGSAAIQGVVCIWSRRDDAIALNHGWSLAAAWPLSNNGLGPFGASILSAMWLPSAMKGFPPVNMKIQTSSEASQDTSAVPSAQLPGMGHDGKERSKRFKVFKVVRNPECGPIMYSKGTKLPAVLLLIGRDGRAHLIHRDTSVHLNLPSTSRMPKKSFFQVQTVSLLSPTLGRINAEETPLLPSGEKLLQIAIHAVTGEPNLLIAFIGSDGADKFVGLSELTIQNEDDDAVIISRPLEPLRLPIQGDREGDEGLHKCDLSAAHITFSSSVAEGKEAIYAIVSCPEASTRGDLNIRTHLLSFRLERRADVSGRGALCEAFGTLESKKRQISDLQEEWDWASQLHKTSISEGQRGLLYLAASERAGKIRAVWRQLHDLRATTERVETIIDASTLEEEQVVGVSNALTFVDAEINMSTNGALIASIGTSSILLRPVAVPNAHPDDAAIDSIVTLIGSSILNGRTYHDILLAHLRLLTSSQVRHKILDRLALGLEWQRGFSLKQKVLPNITIFTTLLEVQKSLCAVVNGHDPDKVDEEASQESLEADWTLNLIHAFKILQCARVMLSNCASWDIASLFNVMPALDYLNDQCEAFAREAFLLQAGHPDTPPEDPETLSGNCQNGTVSVLDLLTRRLLRSIFLLALKAQASFIEWIRATRLDPDAMKNLTASEARNLAQEVRTASLSRAFSQASAEGGGSEKEKLKAELLRAISTKRALAVSARLEVAELGVEEMKKKSAVVLDALESRLSSWTSPVDGKDKSQAWLWPIGHVDGEDSKAREEARKSLARHLLAQDQVEESECFPASSSSETVKLRSQMPLKNGGLGLFLSEDDFIQNLADLTSTKQDSSSTKAKMRDAITLIPLPLSTSWPESRRDLLSCSRGRGLEAIRRTTFIPRSLFWKGNDNQDFGGGGSDHTGLLRPGLLPTDMLNGEINIQGVLGGGSGAGNPESVPPAPSTPGLGGGITPGAVGGSSVSGNPVVGSGSGAGLNTSASGASLLKNNDINGQGQGASTARSGPGMRLGEIDIVTSSLLRPGRVERNLFSPPASSSSGRGIGGRIGRADSWWLE